MSPIPHVSLDEGVREHWEWLSPHSEADKTWVNRFSESPRSEVRSAEWPSTPPSRHPTGIGRLGARAEVRVSAHNLKIRAEREKNIGKLAESYYKKIKAEILTNPMGIGYENYFPEATVERAFLDTIYCYGKRQFDNVEPIDFEKCEDMLSIYEEKITKEDIQSYAHNK